MPVEIPYKYHINSCTDPVPRFLDQLVYLLVMSKSGSSSCTFTYTDTTSIDRSGIRNTAAVRSNDCNGTCSASMSFQIQSMLRKAHLSRRWTVGIILVQFGCPIGTVTTALLVVHAHMVPVSLALQSLSGHSLNCAVPSAAFGYLAEGPGVSYS